MTQTTLTTFDQAGFDAFIESRDEPDWLLAMRREAWQHGSAMQWPERRHEEWIRTDIRAFQIGKFSVPSDTDQRDSGVVEREQVHQLLQDVELAGRIETVDSKVVSENLDEAVAERGVVFGSLSRLSKTHPELVRKHLFTAFDPDEDKFAALHAAFWSGGQILYVPRGVVLDRPVHIGSILSEGGTDTTHTLIVLEEGAEATVLHECNSASAEASGLHLGGGRVDSKTRFAPQVRQLAGMGSQNLQFCPSKSFG